MGPGFSWFVCPHGGVAGCGWRAPAWGGLGWRFLSFAGALLGVSRVVWCGMSFRSGVCRWCCEAGLGWSFFLRGWGSGGCAGGCGAVRSGGRACWCGTPLPLAGVDVVLLVSSVLVGAWRRSASVGRLCAALSGGLAVGPCGWLVAVSGCRPSPFLAEGLAGVVGCLARRSPRWALHVVSSVGRLLANSGGGSWVP